MATEQLTPVNDFCSYHHIEYTVISMFHDAGLLELNIIDKVSYIPVYELPRLERMVRLHTDLGINPEGIEAITHLLERIDTMQQEMQILRNRLRSYE
ncbi:chaperone modulator CbpM [Mucilaginibacter terrae]|uniref:Chaperone modulatory protein CbpM n=1 Tax=Mucilaginibacter terrae TaxID=1955052 RepID=A0ABU3GTW8_9SPHI|nr:chaperone modulator CbpM [Mucilaginibacter terrae]MDT3403223.1 chaperone modulatory protein CbpM [Mucilaginibacter terrae]